MAPKTVSNRHFLLCPVCLKTQEMLSVHLRGVCMKKDTPKAIQAALDRAKRDALDILETGRVFEYRLLKNMITDQHQLSLLVRELEDRHMAVVGVPLQTPSTSQTSQLPGSAADETGQIKLSDNASVSSAKTFQCVQDLDFKKKKELMHEKGLHDRHSLDHPLLKDFSVYLKHDLGVEHFTQEVQNVARYLYYFDRREPTLDFVKDRPKLREYIQQLTEAQLSKQTQLNYLKSLKRFLRFHTDTTSMVTDNLTMYTLCRSFMDFISSLQIICSRRVSKEIVKRRFDNVMAPQIEPKDCLAVLKAAKGDFMKIMGMLLADKSLTLEMADGTLVLYYLEALLILRHLQRPGVLEHMTVTEWISRKRDPSGNTIIAVVEHKTAAQQVAGFALSQEEEMWFHEYFTRVRPVFLLNKEEDETRGRFFISTKGRPIYNASNDVYRLHKKYKLPSVTSMTARRMFETAAKICSDQEKAMIAQYLTHSTATADKHYRMKEPSTLCEANRLIATLAGDSSNNESGDEGTSQGTTRGATCGSTLDQSSSNVQTEIQGAYESMLKTHPVELDGAVPSRTERCKFSPAHARQLYERWLKEQMKLRVKHVLSYFCSRRPTEHRIIAWIKKQGWSSNVPNGAKLFHEWKPSGNEDKAIDSRQIQKLVRSQKWRGLHVTDTEGKGKGVIATRTFRPGEVVCDYHGSIVTAKKGKKILQDISEGGKGYIFFYTDKKGKARAINAHSASCDCHPGQQTFGRMINHSRATCNLRPRFSNLQTDEEEKDVILLIATKKIKVNDELLFDYGVDYKSSEGEGSDLSWFG